MRFVAAVLLTMFLMTGCGNSSDTNDEYAEDFQHQVEEYDAQLQKSSEQAARFDALLDRWEEQADRQDQLLEEQKSKLGAK
jgi:hypothetical protein